MYVLKVQRCANTYFYMSLLTHAVINYVFAFNKCLMFYLHRYKFGNMAKK